MEIMFQQRISEQILSFYCWVFIMFREVGTRKYYLTFSMVNVIISSPLQPKHLQGLPLTQHPDCGADGAESVDFLPGLTQRVAGAVLVKSIVQSPQESLVHHCRGKETCLLPRVRDVANNKTLKYHC